MPGASAEVRGTHAQDPAYRPNGGRSGASERNLLLMVDMAESLQNPTIRRTEREELQRDWIVFSAECSRHAREALAKAAEVLTDAIPGHTADSELAGAWAAVGQGWATLSHAEATRCVAAATYAIDQVGVNTYPNT